MATELTIKDIKVVSHKPDSTYLQKWRTYWFRAKGFPDFSIIKQNGVFLFYSKHCKTLLEAKQHIVSVLNSGKSIYWC